MLAIRVTLMTGLAATVLSAALSPKHQLPAHITATRAGLPEDNTPSHFHLAFAGATSDGMSIAWETDSATGTSVCKYGTATGSLTETATGSARTDSVIYTHVVTLASLKHSTKYFYSCGDATAGFSAEMSFKTSNAAGDQEKFVFGLVGDMGIVESNGVIASLVKNVDTYDFMYHIGDVGYADDYVLYLSTYDKVYATFMEEVEPISSSRAYMALPGNHEASCQEALPTLCPKHEKNFTAWRTRWEMPYKESGGSKNMWYSFDYGSVHFVQISTETDFPGAAEGISSRFRMGPFGDQLSWLEADLSKAQANRAQVPWIIVSGHRPIYYTSGADSNVKAAFEGLIRKYNVDIYFSGHEHNYERYWPIGVDGSASQKDYNNPKDPIFIVNGAGGNAEGHEAASAKPDYLAYRDTSAYGWSRVTVYNSTTIGWEWINERDAVEDTAVITKTR